MTDEKMREALEWALDEIDALSNRLVQWAYPQGMAMLGREDRFEKYRIARAALSTKQEGEELKCIVDGGDPCPDVCVRQGYCTWLSPERANTPPLEEAIKAQFKRYLESQMDPALTPGEIGIEVNEFWNSCARALSPLPAPDAGWRTIDSAPKNGTAIILYLEDEDFSTEGHWREHENGPGWYLPALNEWGGSSDQAFLHTCTHWLPFPAPPVGDGSSLA